MLFFVGCSTTAKRRPMAEPPAPPRVTVAAEPAPTPAAPEPPKPAPGTPAVPETKTPQVLSAGPAREAGAAREGERRDPQQAPPLATEPSPPLRVRQGAAEAPGTPPAQTPGRLVVFNFDNADIEIVLQATSELLVFNYVLAPGAKGKKVTVQTTGKIPVDDIFPVLLTILDVNGLAAVRSGNLYRIIPKEGAVQTSTRTIIGRRLDPSVPGDQVVTLIIPLQYASASDVMGLIRPFVPPQGNISAHRDTNLLVLTDVASNLRRMLDIVQLVDVDVALNELQIIQLRHADAQEVGQILTQLFATGRFRAGAQVPGLPAAPAPPPPVAPGAPPRPPAPGVPPGAAPGSEADRAPLIVPERRSNSLIVYARKQEMETIRRLVEKLDADIYGGQRVYIYFAENTKARDLAATLDAIFGRGTGASPSSTSTGTTTRPGGVGTSGSTGPFGSPGLPSQSSIAGSASRTATFGAPGGTGRGPSFLEEGGASETRFIPDETTNSIIVTTYPRVWGEVEGIIKKLDRMPRQVLIEVLAAEVTLDDSTNFGLQWALQHGRFSASLTQPPNTILPSRPADLIPPFGTIAGAAPGFNFFTFAAGEFLAAINALSTENKVNVLSSP